MFAPSYVRRGKRFVANVRRFVRYRRDLLEPALILEIEGLLGSLQAGIRKRNRDQVETAMANLAVLCEGVRADYRVSAMAECVETFFVAVVLALGFRAFIAQPYRIPTASMYPTLNGVKVHEDNQVALSSLQRTAEKILLGRTYINLVAEKDEVIESLQQRTTLNFFTSTLVKCRSGWTFEIPAPLHEVYAKHPFDLAPNQSFQAGQIIARGWVDTGDQVLVDKVRYHFFPPQRGEITVFDTRNMAGIDIPEGIQGTHFIKRIAGLPGDQVVIDQPNLYVNGAIPAEEGLRRVMDQRGDYHGYQGFYRFMVPAESYFALGDNSFESQDSRMWGGVPQRNLQGRAALVYWPFNQHWGLIR